MTRDAPDALAERVLAQDARATGRAISVLERRGPDARTLMAALYPHTGRAHVIGITGPPGGGKSTLVDRLIEAHRKAGRRVGVVAVDPSSPFTGGAILGDRVRMGLRTTDPGVFIRSLATRGHLGGLSRAAPDAVRVLDAAGYDVILVETVGVGQAEIDIVRLADTVAVVAVPGLGDDIQTLKAGVMEIGDVFVVNKADREGADRTVAEISEWLHHATENGWEPPVIRTIASTGEGTPDLVAALERHRAHLATDGLAARRKRQAEHELMDVLRHEVTRWVFSEERAGELFRDLARAVAARERDPYAAADALLSRFSK